MILIRSILVATLGTAAVGALLPGSPATDVSDVSHADVHRGARIVASGTNDGVIACARCHAFDGAADGSGAFPKLSGIPSYYLMKELRDFASGSRNDAIMSAIASRMTLADIADVAEYYSSIHGTPVSAPSGAPDLLARGERLATVGDEGKEVQACESCHGPRGRGEDPAVPPLAGQYSHYISFQIRMWKMGYRKNDPNQQMANIAKRLSDEDVNAVGVYFEQLPRQDARKRERQP